ncbi:hypothetical protein SERLA73DRAFT_54575 [Serpula lacrymans var. lacrymans S7.3]|uniref:Cytochrome P450 n=1 Tax=Serpula lacrymans var. lacrymans (strain S7.3) TaxID=936435 RepID=F8PYU2_SERL3|nr:hypothetical protein SERLA73DRAFT_54575 [Serpula lacrymans var. lacrymans S7.3]
MVSDVLGRGKGDDPQLEQVLKNASATAYGAGSDTTSSSLLIFVLAMVLYPHVQERAQAEIDAVVGRDRLPRFDDRPSLPYIEAILRETLRWHPVTPLGKCPLHRRGQSPCY